MTASEAAPEAATVASWTLGWRWIIRILALVASLVAVPILVLGGHDALLGGGLGQRLVGVFLALCAVALLAAALLVFRDALSATHRTEHAWVAPALFLAGALPGLLFFVLQISAFVFDWRRILVELVAVLIPVTAVVAVLRASRGEEARQVWQGHRSPAGKAVASLLSAGLVVTAGQTLLSYYAPIKRGDSLSVTTNLVPADQHLSSAKGGGDVQALHGTVYIENTGDAKLVFLGGIYLVTGENVPFRGASDQDKLLRKTLPNEAAHPRSTGPIGVGRYEAGPKAAVSLVKTGLFFDPGTSWIAAGTKVELHLLAYAPKKQFKRYVSSVLLIAARADRMELDAPRTGAPVPTPVQSEGRPSFSVSRKIVEASWVNLITRGARYVYINYSVPTDRTLTEAGAAWPGVTTCVAVKESQCFGRTAEEIKRVQKSIQRWRATYGVNIFPAWYSLEMPSKP